MNYWRISLIILVILLTIGSGTSLDIPFAISGTPTNLEGYSSDQLRKIGSSSPELVDVPLISIFSADTYVSFLETSGGTNNTTIERISTIGDLKKAFEERVEPDNSIINIEAIRLIAKSPGDLTIEQICVIYDYLKNGDRSINGWSYVRDPRAFDLYRYANETVRVGKESGRSGVGDCDDFAILMSALIESIGGTTRIIMAYNNTIGHAYAEVYLGKLKKDSNLDDIVYWINKKYNIDKIFVHIDPNNKDIWLNLDWGYDEKGLAHPGGPYFKGDKHIILLINEKIQKTSLKVPEGFEANHESSILSMKPAIPQETYPLNFTLMQKFILDLKDGNSTIRIKAAEALGILGDYRTVDPLIIALVDENDTVKIKAAESLAMIGNKSSVEPLIISLTDKNPNVRTKAAEALGDLGDPRAVMPLTRLLQYDKAAGEAAIKALVKIGDFRAVDPLINAITSDDGQIQQLAIKALGEMGDSEAVYPLMQALRNENLRDYAVEALGKIGDPRAIYSIINVLKDESVVVRRNAAKALGEIGDSRAIEPLIHALKTENDYFAADHINAALRKIRG